MLFHFYYFILFPTNMSKKLELIFCKITYIATHIPKQTIGLIKNNTKCIHGGIIIDNLYVMITNKRNIIICEQ